MARTKRPSPFLENPPCASSSEEKAEEEEIEGEAGDGSDSDDVLKRKSSEENKNDSDDFFEFSKKPNLKPNVEAPKPKRTKIERIWGEEDEIVVLEGLRVWKNKGKTWNKVNGLIRSKALDGFLDEIKESLHISPVKKAQLYAKIVRLRKRYINAMKNKNDEDEDPVFSRPHDCRAYLIMKDIWSDVYTRMRENIVNAGVDDTVEVGDDDDDDNDRNLKAKWELLDNLPVLGMKECFSKEGLRLIGASKVKKFEKKWKKLHKEELDVNLKRMKLIREMREAVLGAMKSSKD